MSFFAFISLMSVLLRSGHRVPSLQTDITTTRETAPEARAKVGSNTIVVAPTDRQPDLQRRTRLATATTCRHGQDT